MGRFSKIVSATLIGVNLTAVLIIGIPVLVIIAMITFNSGLSLDNFIVFFRSTGIIMFLLFSSIFSAYCFRRERYWTSILLGIFIILAVIFILTENLYLYDGIKNFPINN